MEEKLKTAGITIEPGSNITEQEDSQCLSLHYGKVKE